MEQNQEPGAHDDLQYTYQLKIPKERVAVLIGKKGEQKREIEKATHATLIIDSREGDVEIRSDDPILLFTAKEIVRAIGRGFNPVIALQLLKQDYSYEQIQLNDYVKGKNHFVRIRGRLIGRDGKARQTIEQLTETSISIYGKTVGIIGRIDHVALAKHAVISLIQGSPHSHVYRWLERRRREFREAELQNEPSF